MHGLLLRAIQAYIRATFGVAVWGRILQRAGQPPDGFEPMLPYGTAVLDGIIRSCSAELDRPEEVILEDLGTFLVADDSQGALRRLLRFGGSSFEEFLFSLEELPDRSRLALPYLDLPEVELEEVAPGLFRLSFSSSLPAFFPIAVGALRAMADDYGALVLIDPDMNGDGHKAGGNLTVQVLATTHGEGRSFELVAEGARNGW